MKSFHVLPAALGLAAAQQSAWSQCGGKGWSTSSSMTTCVSGYYCEYLNDYYSQCVPGKASSTAKASPTTAPSKPSSSSSSSIPSSPTSPSSPSTPAGKLQWVGVDESCAEFGTAVPGVYDKDFTMANNQTIQTLINSGYNIFRVPFMMERMAVGSITAQFDPGYLANYTGTINYITSQGAYAVVDPHNYGRYNGSIITDTTAFGTFWTQLATHFKDNKLAIFDTNNEYNTMEETDVYNLNQAAITAIRGAGATSQYIFAEGNSWTGAATWNTTNDSLKTLVDPEDKLIYEMHLYLDSDASGTHANCSSSTIGVERAEGATAWLQENNKLGIIGESAAGQNSVCMEAMTGLMDHLAANNDVWLGFVWWAAGPWWSPSGFTNFEPPSGPAYQYYNDLLMSYME